MASDGSVVREGECDCNDRVMQPDANYSRFQMIIRSSYHGSRDEPGPEGGVPLPT